MTSTHPPSHSSTPSNPSGSLVSSAGARTLEPLVRVDLSRLLRPRSVAAIGGAWAENVVRECKKMNFPGEIWPVNPGRESVCGVPCFGKISDLPGAPDAAFSGVNRKASVRVARELAEAGCGGAVFFAAGFAEARDDGLQRELAEAAGAMPFLGPNCYGLVNYLDGAPLWPDQHGGRKVERGVAVVSQSSNIANNITMGRRGLPLAYVVCAGNQARVGVSQIGAALLEDPRVTALGFYLEGVDHPEAFAALSKLARDAGKPIAVLRAGRTEESRAAALSHTASLAGGDAPARAFFRRIGVPTVDTVPELLEALKLFHTHGALAGNAICSISCSGGEAALMADRAAGRDLRFGALSDSSREKIRAALDDVSPARNPLDYHTFIWGDEGKLTETFSAMMENDFDLSLLVLDFPRPERCDSTEWDAVVRACEAAQKQTGARAAIVSTLPENIPEERAEDLAGRGIAALAGFDEALAAAEAAARFGAVGDFVSPRVVAPRDDLPLKTLDEAEAKRRLSDFGIAVPEGARADSPQAVREAAERLGGALAIKVLGVAHKTEAGAVALNVEDAAAAERFAKQTGKGPWLAERMVAEGAAELLLGVSRDAVFGLTLTIGAGGVLTELLNDAETLLLPTSCEEIRAAVLGLRCAALLTGFRGRAAADVDAVVDAAEKLGRFALAHSELIEEIDINPLIASPSGAVAADALIQIREDVK